jgi:hypothetical protein
MNKLALIALLFAILLLNSISSYAQTVAGIKQSGLTIDIVFPPGNNIIVNGERVPGIDGSEYLSEEWTKGRITMNNGAIIDTIYLRLNVYKNEMHYLYKNVEYSICSPENIRKISIGDRKFIHSLYKKDEGKNSQGYFEVLVDGKAKLLALYYITKINANYNVVLDAGNKNDRLELKERYFIATENSIVEIDKKGKCIFDNLGDKGDILRKRIKEEDLSFKKKEDLVKIITYVNGMN